MLGRSGRQETLCLVVCPAPSPPPHTYTYLASVLPTCVLDVWNFFTQLSDVFSLKSCLRPPLRFRRVHDTCRWNIVVRAPALHLRVKLVACWLGWEHVTQQVLG